LVFPNTTLAAFMTCLSALCRLQALCSRSRFSNLASLPTAPFFQPVMSEAVSMLAPHMCSAASQSTRSAATLVHALEGLDYRDPQ